MSDTKAIQSALRTDAQLMPPGYTRNAMGWMADMLAKGDARAKVERDARAKKLGTVIDVRA